MSDLKTSIIQKVKDELKITDDFESTELYDLLYKYRNSQHPDKFLSDDLKEKAEAKFKDLNILIKELGEYIELEKANKKPHELVLYEKKYDVIQNFQQIIKYEKEIESLKSTITNKDYTIKSLEKEIKRISTDKVDSKTSELINHYKPTKKSLYSLGIIFFLTLLAGSLSKVEEISILINKYSPFDPIIFKYLIFAVLIFIPLRFIKMIWEESRIEEIAKRIKTPKFINEFYTYLNEPNVSESFTEMTVFKFLELKLVPKNILYKVIFTKVLKIYTDSTIDNLKDIFIFNLANKQLVSISGANQLDRKFKIVKSYSFNSDYDDYPF